MVKPRHGKVQELSVVTLVVSGKAGIWSPVPESTPLATALCWSNLFCHKTWPEWRAGNIERAPSQGRESTWVSLTGNEMGAGGTDLAGRPRGSPI